MNRIKNIFTLNLIAVVIGLIAGCIAWLFHLLITSTTSILYRTVDSETFLVTLETLPIWYKILLPAAGGLIVGLLFHFLPVRNAGGEGVPEVMKAEKFSRSKIRPIVIPIKLAAATITLSSGGSAGREGPIVHIGSAIGSTIGQITRRNQADTRLLLAAGAAAGVAGMFTAPIAGVLFSIELILKRFTPVSLSILSIAAFTAALVTKYGFGFNGFFLTLLQPFTLDIAVLLFTIPLGIISGLTALTFGALLRRTTKYLRKTPFPLYLHPALGGLLVGFVGVVVPTIHEPATYATFDTLLNTAAIPISTLILLLVAKMFATSLTLGSGGVGGIFAPSLLMGAVLGTLCGSLLVILGWVSTTSITTFLLVGMAAVFAAATHAPLTAIVVIYEITGDIVIIPLTTIATLVAYHLAKTINRKSIYTEHVHREKYE